MNPSGRNLLPGIVLVVAGTFGFVLGPCLSLLRVFESIASLPNPTPDHLRSGILTSLLWGIPGLVFLVAGMVWLILASRPPRR